MRTVLGGRAGAVISGRRAGNARAVAHCQLILLAIAGLTSCGRVPDDSRTVLTSVLQVRQLSANEAARGLPVRIQGILTYSDRLSSDCFIQDATGGLRVTLASGTPPRAGSKVEVAGLTAIGGVTPSVSDARLTALGTQPLPAAPAVSTAQLRDPKLQYRRAMLRGVVRSISSERVGLITVELRAEASTVWAKVPASQVVLNDDWVDAEVRVSGVLDGPNNGNRGAATMWVSEPEAVEIQRPAPAPSVLPVTKISTLLRGQGKENLPVHRVRVKGAPYKPLDGGDALMDDSGQIAVRNALNVIDLRGPQVDLAGFLMWESGRFVLDAATAVNKFENELPPGAPAKGITLTTAAQVRNLPPGSANLAYQVRLRAVVTYFDPENHLLFVMDRTDGIFVEVSDKERVTLRAGDVVEVAGLSTTDFAPDVEKARIKVVGHTSLPQPSSRSFESAVRGREDCHWLELSGIVQHVAKGNGDSLLTLSWGRDLYKAHVLASPESLAGLVDAEVSLQGVCGALFNPARQMLGIQMFVPERSCIRVLRKPETDTFVAPITSIKDLMKFSRDTDLGHQVRVRGTVTCANRSGATWIRDATGGVMIQDHNPDGLAVGDLVDAVGFPVIAGYSPTLRGARLRRWRSGPPPPAIPVTAHDAMRGGFDGQLVEIEGKLIEGVQQRTEQVLTVQSGGLVFNAYVPGRGAPPLTPGTVFRLTGICAVEVRQSQDLILPRTFRLLLRSPVDAFVVSSPPWLTAERVVPILAGAVLLILAVVAWAFLLGRRVRFQTQALQAQTMQLQAAHQKTRAALEKACEAEALDEDSKRIVELIARDEPVEVIIDRIAEAVALHVEGATCVILLPSKQELNVYAVPALPAGWVGTLSGIRMSSISMSGEPRDAEEFASDPAWAQFVDSQPSSRFETFCSAPIVVDSTASGVIAAFFRQGKHAAETHGEMLALWSNVAALALERRRLHDQLSYRAQHDGLTGLPNRALLYDRLEAEIAAASRAGGVLGLLYVDLDDFKGINDMHGHDVGDAVLQQAARRMNQSVRRGDTVARIGGDEFVVLLPRLSRREDAEHIAAKIAALLHEPMYVNHERFSISGSVGISIWPSDGDQPDALLRFADTRMYGAKRRRWYDAPGQVPHPPSDVLAEAAKTV